MRTSVTGPILTKVWNTPDDRLRRALQARRRAGGRRSSGPRCSTTTTDRQDRRRRLHLRRHDARHLRRDQPLPGRAGGPAPTARRRRASREFLNVQVQQSYYYEPERQPVRRRLQRRLLSASRRATSRPIALTVRANPTNAVGASLRLEYNAGSRRVRDDPGQRHRQGRRVAETTGGWSQRKYLQIVDPRSGRPTTSSARAPT